MITDTDAQRAQKPFAPICYGILTVYYLLWSMVMIRFYLHGIDPDGTSYISLALKYLHGDFANVVSGHWSPMISWIMVPFLATGIDPVLSYKIASIFIGILVLIGVDKLMVEMEVTKPVRLLYLFALSPVIAWYAENSIMADLLCACVVLFYLHAVLQDRYLNRPYAGFAVGFLGALSYLAKSYNFYFFLLHFACINACYWKEAANGARKRVLAINIGSALVAFMLVSGCWIGLITHKYHTLTVGTAGEYNFSHIRPGHSTLTHPMLTDGLMPPPNATAYSVWEDPNLVKIVRWSPFSSEADSIYYLKYTAGNIKKYLRGLAVNPIFDLTLAALFVFCLRYKLHRKTTYILLTVALYPVGYFALYYDGQRYVLLVPILLYLVGAYLLDFYVAQHRFGRLVKISISLVLCIALIALTILRMYKDYPDLRTKNDLYRVSREIQSRYDFRLANITTQGGNWYDGLALTYFLGARYFGQTVDNVSDEQLRHESVGYRIKYHLVFGEPKDRLDILIPVEKFPSLAGDITVCRIAQPTSGSSIGRLPMSKVPCSGSRTPDPLCERHPLP